MAEDLVVQALTALRQKNFAQARDLIGTYAEENALEFQHFLIRGLAELALEDWYGARATFREGTEYFPHQPQLWFNLGTAQENLGDLEDAAESFEHSLDLKADQGDAFGNLSNLYRRMGRFQEAEEMAHRAYEHGASKAQALNSLGLALGAQGKFEAAEKTLQESLRLENDNPMVLANLASLATDQLDFDAAWPNFVRARALSDKPVLRRDEGMARLLAGDFERGWPLYESRLDLPTALRAHPPCPRWKGEPVNGRKILLLAEQGFGDTIMFARYGKLLAEAGAELTWAVQKPLQRLLASNFPGRVFAENDQLPFADYYLPLMSLPFALKKFLPTEAPAAPYLVASSEPRILSPRSGNRKIGLVWTGSVTHERNHERSLLLSQLAPLWWKTLPVEFYAPFTGYGLEQITEQTPVTPLDSLITDFADTAALLIQLDLLVTVDTATAHLAGALGVKTILLLPHCPDWRWGVPAAGTSGETTSWYPSLVLLRQSNYGDWDGVIAKLLERVSQTFST